MIVASFFAGVGTLAAVLLAWKWIESRPRRFNLSRDYFRPCTDCTMKESSKIGVWPERADEEIERAAASASSECEKQEVHV